MDHSLGLSSWMLDDLVKGLPGGTRGLRLGDIGAQGWNVLAEDVPLPAAILKETALLRNSQWMRRFLEHEGAVIAPHGKTTMSPQLFSRQLADGAWAITLATVGQVQVARRFGIGRILLANQLVGRQAMRTVLEEIERDPDFDFTCLVDSVAGVELLDSAVREHGARRPLQVLLEGGVAGRRTGCRDIEQALEVARAVRRTDGRILLRGVEGFEGVIHAASAEEQESRIAAFLDFMVETAKACAKESLFDDLPVILSAGGSAFYDMVTERLRRAELGSETLVVIRSGCYLTHDSSVYDAFYKQLRRRMAGQLPEAEPPRPALELWAYVQSRPDPDLAIVTMGRRDVSFDAGLPVPGGWARPGGARKVQAMPPGCVVHELNDQHGMMRVPPDCPLAVGDMVAFGISHPCTTFDKWGLMFLVDDEYNVLGGIKTFF